MIDFGPMVLNGIEMPFNFNNEDETERVNKLHQLVCDVLTNVDDFGSSLSCDPEVSIYNPDPHSDYDRNYYSVTVYGGLNGTGIWSSYFKSLSDLMLRLEAKFEDVWVIEFITDCTDDAFGVKIGIYPFINQLEGETA